MRAGFAAFGLILLYAGGPAAAQGTAEQRAACTDDAFRLCGEFVPDAATVESCLRRNTASLSPDCRAQFDGGHKARRKGASRRR